MLALFFDGRDVHLRSDYPAPRPGAHEALIQVTLAGICATDLEIVRGYADFRGVLGHEFVGRVVACHERPDLVGRRVVGEINVGCGRCATCRAGRPGHCPQRSVLGIRGRDGAFAEFLTLPVDNLHPVPDSVADEQAVFVEPLAAALEVLQQVRIGPGSHVVVIGDGRLGQLVARVLHGVGCGVIVVGRHERKLALLRQLGIATAMPGQLEPRGADVVVECTGGPQGWTAALALLKPQGTLVLKSTYSGPATVDLSQVVVDEITVVGSRCGPFEPALRLLTRQAVDPRPLVDAVYPLAEGVQALHQAGRSGVLKILLQVE